MVKNITKTRTQFLNLKVVQLCHNRPVFKSCRNGINSYTSSNELDAQNVLPHQTTKRKETTPASHVPALFIVMQKLLQKRRFLKFGTTALCRDAFHWVHKDGRSGRTSQKRCRTVRPAVALYLNELLN